MIRVVVYICVPLGLSGIAVGIYGDHHRWWEHQSFLTNLISSLTSVMFGIPTALLLLGYLSNAQAEALQKQQVRRRARRDIDAFQQVLLRPFSASDLASLRTQKTDLDHAVTALRAVPRIEGAHRRPLEEVREAITAWVDQVRPLEANYQQALASMTSQAVGLHASPWIEDLQAHWEQLDQGLRFQMSEADQAWLTPVRAAELRKVWVELRSANIVRRIETDVTRWTARSSSIEPATTDETAHRIAALYGGYEREHRLIHDRRQWLSAFGVLMDGADELARLLR
ncbi:hypothetical protein [Streptomyces olivaceoviridis]|uniref:hypothetical protein n=1 Tax=Streptomyces olivaceoviridis TaxID=1921 RepID=UPI00167573A5|nr:hypothetical protein [Streptomyces olivaceoviridis]